MKIITFLLGFAMLSGSLLLGQSEFQGHGGVYFLGSANVPVSSSAFSNPDISGVVVRFGWENVETSPGVFDWAFIDNELAKAVSNQKKISLQPLGKPSWLSELDVQTYYYIDKNINHPTYNQILEGIIPWDTVYIARYKIFLEKLAEKYAQNTYVSYVNAVAGNFSRNLPDSVVTDTLSRQSVPFWLAFPYNADQLGAIINQMTDHYMALFPHTPLWCSVDYVRFETKASGKPINYLATIYANYGISNYPDRFGLFREDISGCNPPLPSNTGSHWFIMENNPCRTGAQMLWSVQDGPTRMNQCGILPNTKPVVLDSAVNKAVSLGMRYLEIYGSDILDLSLISTISSANILLKSKENECNNPLVVNKYPSDSSLRIFPNPAREVLNIQLEETVPESVVLKIFNSAGVLVDTYRFENQITIIPSAYPPGIYFLHLTTSNSCLVRKVIIN